MQQRGIRATLTMNRGDGQVRVRWDVWSDGRWERILETAEPDDTIVRRRIPPVVADIVKMWIWHGDQSVLRYQEAPLDGTLES